MNLTEAGRLLAKVSGNDGREVGEVTIMAWQETLADVPYPIAMRAVTVHYRESTDFLMPAHVVKLAQRLRAEDRQRERDDDRDQRITTLAGLPATTRKAVETVMGRRRPHTLTLRRRDMAGTQWAYSCSCGLNPVDQAHPDKGAARDAGHRHFPSAQAVG